MENHQELEWAEAQRTAISEDLVTAAKQQLQFLAAIDRNRHLYDGPALDRAIYRYKFFWLPLLAKHSESQFSEGPLVVPLDCEWIWHCHRLNPVRYLTDCKELYGRIMDNRNVVSSVHGTSKRQTEEIWNMMYPNEPYELDLSGNMETVAENKVGASKSTKYDLVSAVKRQTPFYFQVSRPWMKDDWFLEGALARYKGFLHLIKRNGERNINCFLVPTYDIDLIWHSHQLHPVSYCKDQVAILGKVLQHNDTDSDRTKGKKLDVGSSETAKQWDEAFGSRYWRAGAMYRGSAPSPLTINLCALSNVGKKLVQSIKYQDMIQLPKKMLVEVMLEIIGVRNLPAGHTGSLILYFNKKQPDLLFNTRRRLNISCESGKKQVAAFQCEPSGELLIELVSYSGLQKMLGTTLISLQDPNSVSKLSVENWFELVPDSGIVGSKPISLQIALSFTTPFPAPYDLHMALAHRFSISSFSPLSTEKLQHAKSWTCIVNEAGNEIINIQMRDPKRSEGAKNRISKKEVIGMTGSGETRVLAEFVGEGWLLMGSQWFFQLQKKVSEEDYMFGLIGNRKMVIFRGRKLDYELNYCRKEKNERDFMTIVEFSEENPYGKAVALLNLETGFLKVEEQWLVLPGITVAFILSDILKKEGYDCFTSKIENSRETDGTFDKDVEVMLKGGCGHENMAKCFSGWNKTGSCGGCGVSCGGGGSCGGGSCRSDADGNDKMMKSNNSSGCAAGCGATCVED
ncbi:glycine-rich domain-containing protein 1-like [Cornus florida]|uniref:glycine-rich domain-containing protein 1-like n=1 Tax=Cornus florida TaxID=4283 RepID=UPI00289A2B34|nr:glycine-rich domain-containing protein 1-like [Cornus florida]